MKKLKILCAALFLCYAASIAFSEEPARTAAVAGINGNVMVKNPGPGSWVNAKVDDLLSEGSFIKTGIGAMAVLNIDNGRTATVNLSEKSLVSIETLIKDPSTGMKKTLLCLSIGQVLIKAEKLDAPDSKFEVRTPTSVVGVRGTKFSVKVDALK